MNGEWLVGNAILSSCATGLALAGGLPCGYFGLCALAAAAMRAAACLALHLPGADGYALSAWFLETWLGLALVLSCASDVNAFMFL